MRFMRRHRKLINIFIILACVVVFVYFTMKTINRMDINIETKTYPGTAMGTAIKKTIYAESVTKCDEVDVMIDSTLQQLEEQISVRIPESEISKINSNYVAGGVCRLSDNVWSYLEAEMQIYEESKGAFSPCIRPISALWGIEDGLTEIPGEVQIRQSVICANASNLELVDNGMIIKETGMALDLGAAGKGIACDEVKKQLDAVGVQGAVISIGGSILTYGDKGNGKEWHIGIQDPRGKTGEMLGVVDVEGGTIISTSGDYEKYFELDGKRYHHIFDPTTGYPVDNGLISVTIICDSGLLSDALSTACFVMGLEDGMDYAEEKGVGAVFVTSDKKVHVTKSLKKTFRLQADGYELVK